MKALAPVAYTRSIKEKMEHCIFLHQRSEKDGDELGANLIDLKDELPRGQFMPALREMKIPQSTANYWMKHTRDKRLPPPLPPPKLPPPQTTNVGNLPTEKTKAEEPPAPIQIGGSSSNLDIAVPLPEHTILSFRRDQLTEPPSAAKVLDEVAGRISKYNHGGDITKIKELIKHRDQYSPQLWEAAKGAIERSIRSLTSILEEMKNV